MSEYRWNKVEFAECYDAAAEYIHPFYDQVQSEVLHQTGIAPDDDSLLVDLGGGSGRLAERYLDERPQANVVVVDQSEAFLTLAQRRLDKYGSRAATVCCRLQDDWASQLGANPAVIVSTSAIHHLDPREKRTLFSQVYSTLPVGGVFVNGDEFRPEDDAEYLQLIKDWTAHMHSATAAGLIPPVMQEILAKWEERNIERFDAPRHSGDDCHETVAIQESALRAAGFQSVQTTWHKRLWAVMVAHK